MRSNNWNNSNSHNMQPSVADSSYGISGGLACILCAKQFRQAIAVPPIGLASNSCEFCFLAMDQLLCRQVPVEPRFFSFGSITHWMGLLEAPNISFVRVWSCSVEVADESFGGGSKVGDVLDEDQNIFVLPLFPSKAQGRAKLICFCWWPWVTGLADSESLAFMAMLMPGEH